MCDGGASADQNISIPASKYPALTLSQTSCRAAGKNGSTNAPPGAGERLAGKPVPASRASSCRCANSS